MSLFLIALVSGVAMGALGGKISIGLATKGGIVAVPNHRSSHDRPTPRVGGIRFALPAILFAIISLVVLWGDREQTSSLLFFLVIGVLGCGAFVIGYWDDRFSLSAAEKLTLQIIIAGTTAVLFVLLPDRLMLGIAAWSMKLPPFVMGAIIFIWIIFVMNAYNFMDGVNGKAATFGVFVLAGYAFLGMGVFSEGDLSLLFIAFFIGTLIAFLWSNFHGREFMGDCGSLFLGFVFAVMPIIPWGGSESKITFVAGVIFLMPFLYDVTRTLIVRTVRGEKLWKAHHDHLYQKLVKLGWSHVHIVLFNAPFYFLCIACGVAYALSDVFVLQTLCIIDTLAAMILYNIVIIRIESGSKPLQE